MLAVLLFLVIGTHVNHKKTDLPQFILDSIVVKGEKQSIHTIYTIPDSVIESKNVSDNEEILNLVPSLNFAYSAKGYGILTFRGNDAKRITVLFDGIPFSLPYSSTFDISQIPPAFFNSVSLLSASSPIIAGKDAIGGVVNITAPKIKKITKIQLSIGSGNALNSSVFFGDTMGKLAYIIGYSFDRSDGFPISSNNPYGINGLMPNSYFVRKGLYGKTRLTTLFGTFKADLLFIDNEKGVAEDLSTSRPRYWRFPVWQKKTLSLRYTRKTLSMGIYRDSYYNILDSYDDSTYQTQKAPYAFHSTYDDHSMGGYIQLAQTIGQWKLLNVLTLKKDIHQEQPDYNENWKEINAFLVDYGIHSKRSFSMTTLEIVMEGIYHSQGPRKLFYPQFTASIARRFNRFNIFFAASKKIRFPSLKEMYSTYSGSAYPNPDLKPESSYNFDIHATAKMHGFRMYMALYHSKITQLIQKVKIDSLYKTVNIESANLSGIETGINGHLSDIAFSIFASYNHGKDNNNRPLNLVPESKAGITFHKPFLPGTAIYVDILYTGKRKELTKDSIYTHAPYTITNVTLTRRYKNLHLYFKIHNIFDTFYEYQRGIPAKGLYAETGIKILIQ